MTKLTSSIPSHREIASPSVNTDDDFDGVDVRALVARITEKRVLLGGLLLLAIAVAWRIDFLSHLYFRLDDFIDLDIAIQSPFNWKYVTYNGVGHLIIGVRALGWFLARTSLYNWPLDSAVDLIIVALSGLAALRLLRNLFGDRVGILIPFAIYLFCPLTMPGLGEWSSALEALPLQLAIFMSLDAQVRYVRTGRRRYFVQALLWVVFGLLFNEKGLVLPLLIFAFTSAFFAGGSTWLRGMWLVLRRYWRDWVCYTVLMLVYGYILAESLKTSRVQPSAPASESAAWHLTWGLVGKTFLPGAFGGPWRWFGGSTYALASPESKLVILSVVAAIVVVVVTIRYSRDAWRAWAILGAWVLAADVFPIVIGRLNNYPLDLLASETRYVNDAVPILAICVALAFLPRVDKSVEAGENRPWLDHDNQLWQYGVGGLTAVVMFGSLWSVQAYEDLTSSRVAADYIENATLALQSVPTGARIANLPAPPTIILNHNGTYVPVSQFIGDMQYDKLGHHVVWVNQPRGTIDALRIFGPDGRLYLAKVTGVNSAAVPAKASWHGCWPERHGKIVVRLAAPALDTSNILRIGYIWIPRSTQYVTVAYRHTGQLLEVRRGLHTAYLPVAGTAKRVVFEGLAGGRMCVGDVEVGTLAPNTAQPSLPESAGGN